MTVTKDATSGKCIPQSAAEWTTLLSGSGISNPSILLLCQEASGSLTDTIGGYTFTVFAGAPSYQNAVTGWSSKGVKCAAGSNDAFSKIDTVNFPNITTQSLMAFAWIKQQVPNQGVTDEQIISFGQPKTNFGIAANANASGANSSLRCYSAGNVAAGATSSGASGLFDGAVHPLILQINRASSTTLARSDLETVTPTFGSPSAGGGVRLFLGGDATNSTVWGAAGTTFLYVAFWFLTAAELDTAHITTLLSLMNGSTSGSRGRSVNSGGIGSKAGSRGSIVNSRGRNLDGRMLSRAREGAIQCAS